MSPFMPTPPPIQPPMPAAVSDVYIHTHTIKIKFHIYLILFIYLFICSKIGLKHPASKSEEEPQAKKLRTEDSLIPEQQFLARNKVKNKY